MKKQVCACSVVMIYSKIVAKGVILRLIVIRSYKLWSRLATSAPLSVPERHDKS